jgi:hypothetical protein
MRMLRGEDDHQPYNILIFSIIILWGINSGIPNNIVRSNGIPNSLYKNQTLHTQSPLHQSDTP